MLSLSLSESEKTPGGSKLVAVKYFCWQRYFDVSSVLSLRSTTLCFFPHSLSHQLPIPHAFFLHRSFRILSLPLSFHQVMLANLRVQSAFASLNPIKPLIIRRWVHYVYLSWQKPSVSFVKLNYDGAVKDNSGKAGIGGIIRDHEGKFLLCFAEPITKTTSLRAEMLAAKRGVALACENGWPKLWIEGDAKAIVEVMHGKQTRDSELEKHAREMQCQFSQLEDYKCTHIYREGNMIADRLAHIGLRMKVGEVWQGTPPSQIHKYILGEAAGAIFKRRIK